MTSHLTRQQTGGLASGNAANHYQPTASASPTTPLPAGLLEIVWRSRWILLISVVSCLGLAMAYLRGATPTYTSVARVYVEQTGPRIMSEMEAGVMTRSMNYLHTQAKLLTSTPILSAALKEDGMAEMMTLADVNDPIEYLSRTLKVTVGDRDDLISVAAGSPFPEEAAQLVNNAVDAYIAYHATTKRSTSAEVLKILRTEKAERGAELSEKLQKLTDFKKQNVAVSFDSGQGNLILNQIDRLSTALTEARLLTVRSESFRESVKTMVDDPVALRQFVESQGADSIVSVFPAEKARLESTLDDLERRRANWVHQLTAQHPTVAALDAQIDQARRDLAALNQEYAQAQVAAADQRYVAARRDEEQITRQLNEKREEFAALNDKLTEYAHLQSEYDQVKRLCDVLDERIEELHVTEDVGALNISVVEWARPATEPTEPQAARVLSMGLAGGLMLGGTLALMRHVTGQHLRSVDDVSATLRLPVLGAVPSFSGWWRRRILGRVTYLRSQSGIAEAYRTISTAVLFGAADAGARSILVTSAVAGEGKSTLVSNLAIAMAQAGQRTIIVDADFRAPVQDMIFRLDHENMGLSGVLTQSCRLDDAIQATEVKNLDVLPCGHRVLNPSELLNSAGFERVLGDLAEHYDLVLIDSPPVTPFADARVLAGIASVTILALQVEKSRRKAICSACESLRAVGAQTLGVVLSNVHEKSGRYGYCYGHRDYYKQPSHSLRAQKWRRRARGKTRTALANASKCSVKASVVSSSR